VRVIVCAARRCEFVAKCRSDRDSARRPRSKSRQRARSREFRLKIDSRELALLCQRAENEFVGARVGIMDQFVSLFGQAQHALLLDCRSLEFKLLPLPDNVRLIICNTMVKHELASSAYNERRAQCEAGVRCWRSFIRTSERFVM
jgi:galactokinase